MQQPVQQQLEGIPIRDVLAAASMRLKKAGIESYILDARLLVMESLGLSREALVAANDDRLSDAEVNNIRWLIERRAKREPLSHILGKREFWSLTFDVTPATLDPRPDSETLIEAVLEAVPEHGREMHILDLGTGTGCLLLSLLVEYPNATGVGVDISTEALAVAMRNEERILNDGRASLILSNWTENVTGKFDVIISNPPYIAEEVIDTLEPEVSKHEPRGALSGGADGLDAYRMLALQLAGRLLPEGVVVLEIGYDQQEQVNDIMQQAGFRLRAVKRDLSGIARCLVFNKP